MSQKTFSGPIFKQGGNGAPASEQMTYAIIHDGSPRLVFYVAAHPLSAFVVLRNVVCGSAKMVVTRDTTRAEPQISCPGRKYSKV